MNILTNVALSSTTHISISHPMQDSKIVHHKNYINIMLLHIISNKSSRGVNKFQFYRQNYSAKELTSVGYKFLFLCLVFNGTTPTRQLVCVMQTEFEHANFRNDHFIICDNVQITIITIICLYHFFPIKNTIPDNCPSVVTKKPVSITREPKNLSGVIIKETVPAGFSVGFVLNDCRIIIHDSNPQEYGCGGRLCDKQSLNEILEYKQGCC